MVQRKEKITSISTAYTMNYVAASEAPCRSQGKRRKYEDIEAAVRAAPAGKIVQIAWPMIDGRRQWASNIRTALRDRGCPVKIRSDSHFLYVIPKTQGATAQ